nr:MAG TPA: DNA POLYMERASE [Bacteriophage sp.]
MMLYPLLHYENEKIWLDGDVLKNLYRVATERVDKMERDVYAMIGGQINLNSPVQVAQAFERLGIDTGERTSKGTMSVGIKILADLPKEYVEKFPALKSYINYKKTAKLLSSYIKPLMKEYESRGYCRFAYKTTEVPCLTEDNYVYIKGKGLISIKGVEVNDLIWTQYGYKKVLWNNKKWSDEIYRLTLKNGTQLVGTGHHPVLLNTSNNLSDLSLIWSGISSTTVGDTVVCNSHSIENEDTLISIPNYVCEGRKEVTIPKVMDKKLARLVGFLDGDGCLLSDRIKLAFNTKETEIIEYYISLMSEVFNIESGKLYHSPNSNSSDCCFFSTDIVRFLKSINVRQKLSDTVSEYIKNSSYDIWVEYLCGLFDSDGCLLKSKDLFVPSVKGIKGGMIKDVHQMLLFLGINSSIHTRPSTEGNKTQYEIRVTGDRGRCYFRDTIGKNLVHNMRRDRAINNKVSAFYDIHVNNVASVEKCLNIGDYVYDIEVEDVHEYIANGIVTHNTGRLACGKDGKNSFFSPINAQCVVGSSELFTDRGVKTIKDISVGDNVWDGESFRRVLNTYNNGIQAVYKVTLCDGKTLICTDKHQLYSNVVFSAFRELKDLNVEDSVAININSVDIGFSDNNLNTRISYDFDNVVGWVKIKSIEYVGKEEVYDIHVDVTHRYCVNGFITHNSLPKPHVKMEDVFDLGDRNLFSKKDNIIMGYKFVYSSYDEEGKHIVPEDSTYIGWVEGMDDDLNLRMAISPKMLEDSGDDEFLYCSFDYAAEELRIAANLSREPNWVEAFTSGNDIHKSTACAIWGEEHYNRDYRKMAKYANFSILYGASSHSLYADSRYGFKSLQEAEDFYNKYKKALPTLFQWQDRIIASAKRKGMLQTFFGRPRRLRSYYENRQIGFANRSAGNTSVQGVAGDILKMVMIKLWKVVFNNEEFKNDVSWRVAIHDEIGYTIRATKLMRALKVIKETQSVKLPEWPVEIITDPSVGWSMGRVYDFHMVEDDSELGYHFEPDLA